MALGDLDFLYQLKRLKNIGDVIQPPDPSLHHSLRQKQAVYNPGSKLKVDLGICLKTKSKKFISITFLNYID